MWRPPVRRAFTLLHNIFGYTPADPDLADLGVGFIFRRPLGHKACACWQIEGYPTILNITNKSLYTPKERTLCGRSVLPRDSFLRCKVLSSGVGQNFVIRPIIRVDITIKSLSISTRTAFVETPHRMGQRTVSSCYANCKPNYSVVLSPRMS